MNNRANKKKQLLLWDLDGTLLNDAKEVTEGNRLALEQALEREHGVVIATGRPLKSAKDLAHRLSLDKPGCMMIASNGAILYDWAKNDTIFTCTLPIPSVRKLFAKNLASLLLPSTGGLSKACWNQLM